MPGKQSRTVEQIFMEAVDLPRDARAVFLGQRCAGDSAIRREVEALLVHDERAGSTFLSGAREVDDSPRRLPERLGSYRIVREIGAGGMGVVYEARQDNPDRAVALKVIRPGSLSRQALRRFAAEGEILGRLRHDGIARILEAGHFDTNGERRPFIAMELINGEPLDRHCRRHHAPPRARIELLAKICDAVHHAHTRGIVHRDLKPANILVDDTGSPRILDFGVARLTRDDSPDTAPATLVTNVGQLIGTLPYMSPEQVAGDPAAIDGRTDVYSLGVILYELLAGVPPLDVGTLSLPEAIRVIREDEPTRLGSVDAAFSGDIETIVAKALSKEVERRYASAAELAEDLRRHLTDEPIRARPTSTLYQLRKFAKRNRGVVAAVAAAFATLVVGVVAVALLAASEHAARLDADASRELAERSAFRASIAAAIGAVDSATGGSVALKALDDAPPRLRHWEWHLVRRLADPSVSKLTPSDIPAAGDIPALRYALAQNPTRFIITDAASGTSRASITPTVSERVGFAYSGIPGVGLLFGLSGCELRNLLTGDILWADPPSASPCSAFSFSPDQSLLGHLIDRGNTLLIRRTSDGSILNKFRAGLHPIIVFSRDNSLAAVGNVICDLRSGREIRTTTTGSVHDFSPDGSLTLVVGPTPGGGSLCCVEDTESGELRYSFPVHTSDPWQTAVAVFSEDGRTLYANETARMVYLRDAHTGLRLGPSIGGVAAPLTTPSGSGVLLAVSPADGTRRTFSAHAASPRSAYRWFTGQVFGDFSPDGSLAVTCDWGHVTLTDATTGTTLWRRAINVATIRAAAFSPDARRLAVDGGRGRVLILDCADGATIAELPSGDAARGTRSLAWSPDGRSIYVSRDNGHLLHWSPADTNAVDPILDDGDIPSGTNADHSRSGRPWPLDAMNISRDGRFLAGASRGTPASAVVIQLDNPARPTIRVLTNGAPTALALSPDNALIAVACDDRSIRIIRPSDGVEIGHLQGAASNATSLRWLPDGSRLLAGTEDGHIYVFDRFDGEQRELMSFPVGTSLVRAVAFRPGNASPVSAITPDGLVTWDIDPPTREVAEARFRLTSVLGYLPRVDLRDRTIADAAADIAADASLPEQLRADLGTYLSAIGESATRLNSDAWSIAVRAGVSAERAQLAVHLAQAADSCLPNNAAILNTLAYAHLRAGAFADAIDAFRRSIAASPRSARLVIISNHCGIAIAAAGLRDTSLATASLASAEALATQADANDPELTGFLNEARQAVGNATVPAR
jgi:WD40 repeat protein